MLSRKGVNGHLVSQVKLKEQLLSTAQQVLLMCDVVHWNKSSANQILGGLLGSYAKSIMANESHSNASSNPRNLLLSFYSRAITIDALSDWIAECSLQTPPSHSGNNGSLFPSETVGFEESIR